MAAEKGEPSDRKRTKSRHRRPCVNHPKKAAVARCEVCGKPICKECAQYYEDARICGEGCWGDKISKERGSISAKERQQRKKREKRADRAVSAGVWIVALALLAAVGVFVVTMMADHAGEKLWESSDPGFSHSYSAQQHMSTAYYPSENGSIEAIDVLTGQKKWSVRLPEEVRASRLQGIDDDRCLVRHENKALLCSSTRNTPVWEITTPLPALHTEPVVFEESIYLASAALSYYSSYAPVPEAPSATSAMSLKPSEEIGQEDEEQASVIIVAGDMASGAVRWQTEMEDIKVGGLLADENRVYVAGSRPGYYTRVPATPGGNFMSILQRLELSYYTRVPATPGGESGDEDTSEGAGDEEPIGKTQLWALNAETGKPEWKLEGTGSFHASPMMSDHGIVFSTRENIYLVSPEGKIEWKHPLRDKSISSLKPHDDKLLVSAGGGFLLCLDLESGRKEWMTQTGAGADKIVPAFQQVCVSGLVPVDRTPRKVMPTKRWKGSEDLLKRALKASRSELEPALFGIDLDTGDVLWSISKIEGDFEYADGVLYALRHSTKLLLMDGSVDPGDISKTVTTMGAYDCMTGERLWETTMDGYASDLRLAQGVALAVARSATFSLSRGGQRPPARLIAISLH